MATKSTLLFLDNIETHLKKQTQSKLKLQSGGKIAVVGGGPAGSFFSYFALGIADQIGLDITLDIYEPQNFFMTMPRSCNKCGGIISETLYKIWLWKA